MEKFEDEVGGGKKVVRNPGEVWRIVGPREYWLPLQVRQTRNLRPVFRIPSLGIFLFDYSQIYIIVAVIVALIAIFFLYL